mmetsp:Transcript_16902/g.46204  ORF Transcript_16902/g.46204 Transcript_16902/m.46204 type:complete len:205 (+) Transcript_16902:156-770(+)
MQPKRALVVLVWVSAFSRNRAGSLHQHREQTLIVPILDETWRARDARLLVRNKMIIRAKGLPQMHEMPRSRVHSKYEHVRPKLPGQTVVTVVILCSKAFENVPLCPFMLAEGLCPNPEVHVARMHRVNHTVNRKSQVVCFITSAPDNCISIDNRTIAHEQVDNGGLVKPKSSTPLFTHHVPRPARVNHQFVGQALENVYSVYFL